MKSPPEVMVDPVVPATLHVPEAVVSLSVMVFDGQSLPPAESIGPGPVMLMATVDEVTDPAVTQPLVAQDNTTNM